jgi:hypothetical protein
MKPQRTPKRRKPPRRKKAQGGQAAQPSSPPPPVAPAPVITPGAAAASVPVAGGVPQVKRPAPRRPRPTAKKKTGPKPAYGGGGGISVMTVLLLVVALIIAGTMIKVMLPPSLDGVVKGYPKAQWADDDRNLLKEGQDTLMAREQPLEISEQEVNAYLRDRIKGSQGGPFSAIVKYQGTYVDFEEGSVEIYVVRTVLGKSFPISSKIIAKDVGGGQYTWMTVDGSVGGFRTGKRQFQPVYKAIQRVQETCKDEMDVLSRLGKVTFKKDSVVLDPKG